MLFRYCRQSLKRIAVIFILPSLMGLEGCSSLPANVERSVSRAYTDTEATLIGQHIHDDIKAQDTDLTGFYPLVSGLDAMVTRLALVDAAQRSVDVQYYIYKNDLAGKLLTKRLLLAADRGVRVRLLLDDIGTSSFQDDILALLNQHPNIKIRLFNPVPSRGLFRGMNVLSDLPRINRRMHNKAFIVDNQVAIIGGRNIGDEYFNASSVDFADLDMVQIGAAVPEISGDFDEYWNSRHSYPTESVINSRKVSDRKRLRLQNELEQAMKTSAAKEYLDRLRSAPVIQKIEQGELSWFWGNASVYADLPDKVTMTEMNDQAYMSPRLLPYFNKAKEKVVMVSAYFVPGKDGVEFIRSLRARGIEVTIVTNSLASTDVAMVHAGYARYREALLDAGVELIEMKPKIRESKRKLTGSSKASLHAKTYIIDDRIIFVGSLNLDPRSVALNTENGVIYHSSELGDYMFRNLASSDTNHFWRLQRTTTGIEWINESGQIDATSDPQTSWLLRFGIQLLSVLPIESQL